MAARGKRGPRPEARESKTQSSKQKTNGKEKSDAVLKCDDCTFTTPHYPEIVEHLSGSGHTGYQSVTKPEPELFTEPKPVMRKLKVPLSAEEKQTLNSQAAIIAMQLVEQREIATLAKERSKALEADQNALVAKLRDQYKMANVSCEWRVNFDENSKQLIRLDSNEVVETCALSAEDRALEAKRIEALNQQPPQQPQKAMEASA